ncbi:MAG TPA: hypothetical protein VE136_05065 [Anaerolineales bacterium]|jgi:hypothetical protein|nr:hypothetical protein [Anaerolineales bacterium]
MASSNNDRSTQQFDFDLHGVVGIRLLYATAKDYAIVRKQLGPIEATLARSPDVVIKFVDKLPVDSTVRLIGVDEAGFTNDAFIILRGKQKSSVKVQIPLEQIGKKVEMVCERGLQAVPLLIPIINFAALSKGVIPLHASAFTYNNVGVLVTGWAKGGKTETLLAFTSKGAEYIGDEWVYLSEDGKHMYGIPEPIRVWNWHLRYLPEYWSLLRATDRARLRGLSLAVSSIEMLISGPVGQDSVLGGMLTRMRPLLKNQLYVHLSPQKLFGQNGRPRMGKPEKIFFVASHESEDISVHPIDAQEVAHRMVFSLQEERIDLMSAYRKFRFAFPHLRNKLIEDTENLQREALQRILADKESFMVYHPYPVSIPSLFDALSPFVGLPLSAG